MPRKDGMGRKLSALPLLCLVLAHLLVIGVLGYYSWRWAAVTSFVFLLEAIFWWHERRGRTAEFLERISALETKVNVLTEEIIQQVPIGTAIIDSNGLIVWHNDEFGRILDQAGPLRGRIGQYLPQLRFRKTNLYQELSSSQIAIRDKIYRATLGRLGQKEWGRRIIYLEDVTEQVLAAQRYLDERPIIGFLQLDNLAEVLANLEEDQKPVLIAAVDRLLSEWTLQLEGYLRKFAEDRYLVIMSAQSLRDCQKNRFEILDRLREINLGNKMPVTLSIGLGAGEETAVDLARLAQSALDIALGRGGDQVVIKTPERVWFYGGRSRGVEKRTKVKARVIAFALRDLIREAGNVVIMGHEGADLDELGAALGLAKVVSAFERPVHIVLDNLNALEKMVDLINKNENYRGVLISGNEGLRVTKPDTLLIVVDTHRPTLLIEPRLLELAGSIVVIDHHRRSEEFIDTASLVYLEPYASSTSELVAELLQYLGEEVEITKLEATGLLAGIIMDTKNFTAHTGARTFEAASFLRRAGADPTVIQEFMRDDLDAVVRRAEIIKNTELVFDGIAVSTYDELIPQPQLTAAQAADALLNVDGVKASFVICRTSDGVAISARSQGEINVQLLMEKLGGGGHLNVAAAQLSRVDPAEARVRLMRILQENFKEGEKP
ncbi:MAG: hypothetical protein HPY81_04735 [Firmicutes bacterium]|nr:hypothetical protein [Bacillota bacterium]